MRHRSWLFPAIVLALASFAGAFSGLTRAEDFTTTQKSGLPGVAGIVGTGDFTDAQAAVFRTTLSSADTLTKAGILATPEFQLVGRQVVKVSARFSASAATCKVRLAYINKTTRASSATSSSLNFIIGYSDERTLTAGTVQYEGSYYPTVNGDEFFDGAGALVLRVLITSATSAGTVDLWVGSK